MTKRIQTLAEQAGAKFPAMGADNYTCFDHEKFARLIINECVAQANSMKVDAKENIYSSTDNVVDCMNERIEDICGNIKDHFGIK